jgi:hypothetical protein
MAIQNAIASVANSGSLKLHGTVYFPRGEYRISAPLNLTSNGIRLIGEGEYVTYIQKVGTDSTTIVFSNANALLCEVAHLHFGAASGSPTSGAVFFFNTIGVLGTRIHDVFIENAYQGIACSSTTLGPGATNTVNEVAIHNVKMSGIINVGIYLNYALNWMISNVVINMQSLTAGYGVQLDTQAEGCLFHTVYVLHGEYCWRFNKTVGGSTERAPTEHRFYFCSGDNGYHACFYASALHRSIFHACWASTQSSNATAAFVIDGSLATTYGVWGLVWDNGQIVNSQTHGFYISAVSSITVSNSMFAEWGRAAANTYFGITIAANLYTNFIFTGNTFCKDTDFTGNPWWGINVNSGTYNRYVVTNNVGYGDAFGLGAGTLPGGTVADSGYAASGKVVTNNL